MPVSIIADYTPPWFLRGGDVQTLFPVCFRWIQGVEYERRRLELDDGDFMDLDWARGGHARLVVLLHGLSSSSGASYMRGMTRALNAAGRDVVCMNFRGCSGEPNRLPQAYHSGSSGDLDAVIRHLLATTSYDSLIPIGFSLGGSVVLKWLGEAGSRAPRQLVAGAAISVPCDLRSAAYRLAEPRNRLYMERFLWALRRRFEAKRDIMPPDFDWEGLSRVRSFLDYDEQFTAPLHGFDGAEDYWRQSSANRYVGAIRVPTLLINAVNDPFFSAETHPVEIARDSECLHLEQPRQGGHLGFPTFHPEGLYWHESRVLRFLDSLAR